MFKLLTTTIFSAAFPTLAFAFVIYTIRVTADSFLFSIHSLLCFTLTNAVFRLFIFINVIALTVSFSACSLQPFSFSSLCLVSFFTSFFALPTSFFCVTHLIWPSKPLSFSCTLQPFSWALISILLFASFPLLLFPSQFFYALIFPFNFLVASHDFFLTWL